jgi:hypothetical protein
MNPEQINHRQGCFGEFVIDGTLWQYPDKKREWRLIVTSFTTGRADKKRVNIACRVFGDDFRCVEVGTIPPDFEVMTGESLLNIDPPVKEAIREAIAKWESEIAR